MVIKNFSFLGLGIPKIRKFKHSFFKQKDLKDGNQK